MSDKQNKKSLIVRIKVTELFSYARIHGPNSATLNLDGMERFCAKLRAKHDEDLALLQRVKKLEDEILSSNIFKMNELLEELKAFRAKIAKKTAIVVSNKPKKQPLKRCCQ